MLLEVNEWIENMIAALKREKLQDWKAYISGEEICTQTFNTGNTGCLQ